MNYHTTVPFHSEERSFLELTDDRFLKARSIYLTGEIDDRAAESIISQLQYLQEQGDEEIFFYLNTPGGDVYAALAIADAMNVCSCDIVTIGTGLVASAGAVLLSCGAKGKRFVTPLCDTLVHQPSSGVSGRAADIAITAAHIEKLNHKVAVLLSETTGQPYELILNTWTKDCWMNAQEALEYGLCDKVGFPKRAEV